MAQRTISVPQRAGSLQDPLLYETLSRIIAGVNLALALPSLPSIPTSPSGLLQPTNPLVKLVGGGAIRTIGAVDFSTQLILIASDGDVQLETGGNIGQALFVGSGSACALVRDPGTGLWWPISGLGPPLFTRAGNVGIGVDPTIGPLQVELPAAGGAVYLDGYGALAVPLFIGRRALGSKVAPAAMTADEVIGGVGGIGYGATAFASEARASLVFAAAAGWTDTDQSTRAYLLLTPDGTTTPAIVLTVDQDGGVVFTGRLKLSSGAEIFNGAGSPEGVVAAKIGSLYLRSDGGAGTTAYIKESGTSTTGWIPK